MSKAKVDLKDVQGVKVTTPLGRLSFPKLFKPEQYQGKGDAKYQATLLFPKNTDLTVVKKAITQAQVNAFGEDKKKWPKMRLPWRDGDQKEDLEGYAGNYYINCSTKRKPVVIGRDKEPITEESEIYGGQYGRFVVVAKVTEASGNYFVSLYLQGYQKVKDGPAFGGGVNIEKDFSDDDLDDVDEESDDMGMDDDSDDEDDDNI